jgi:squalene-associated FAD-dependent desaturase
MESFKLVKLVHVVGSGLSGLSSAVWLSNQGIKVILYEASSYAGGRCRSYFDAKLGKRIDNGNHLVLSGNLNVKKYLRQINSLNLMWVPNVSEYNFFDLHTKERWIVRPDQSRIPWSLLKEFGRIPESSLSEYLRGLKLIWGRNQTVSDCLSGPGPLFRKFWEPLSVSVLNTEASNASARLLWPVLAQTFGKGEAACRPMIPRKGLSEVFVNPAIRYLEDRGGTISFKKRLKSLFFYKDRVASLNFSNLNVEVKNDEGVILALPVNEAKACVPNLIAPTDFRPIVNGHFCLSESFVDPFLIGLVGGVGHWIFVRNGIASVTISAATEILKFQTEEIAMFMWREICEALKLGKRELGAYRILREKRATFAQTPEQLIMRPKQQTCWVNMALAGDWVDTGLPATIEGSLKSGLMASNYIVNSI